MKKTMKRALAMMLMLCMVLSQTAFAATTYYIEVSISDESGKTVTGESSHYATRQEPLAAAVVDVIHTQYEELETVFAKTGLRGIVDSGLEAFAAGKDAWGEYVDEYYGSVKEEFKDVLKDVTSTYADMTVNEENVLTWTDEDDDMGYTVTITLRSYTTGTADYTVKVGEGKGTVTLSRARADAGKTITINADPAEGYMVNRVTAVTESGVQLTVTALSGLAYTFTMPKGNVTVHVTYKLAPKDPAETGVADKLITDERIAYMQGKDDGLFHPEQSITRAEVAMIFYRLLRTVEPTETAPFTDVAAEQWYATAVNTLADIDIIKGMTATSYEPGTPITRAQFVTICTRFAEVIVTGHTFEDVDEDYWAKDYISTAASFGWVTGVTEELFAPDRSITRAEAATMVNRVLGRIADRAYIDSLTEQRYPDVNETNWAWYDINEASQGKLVR